MSAESPAKRRRSEEEQKEEGTPWQVITAALPPSYAVGESGQGIFAAAPFNTPAGALQPPKGLQHISVPDTVTAPLIQAAFEKLGVRTQPVFDSFYISKFFESVYQGRILAQPKLIMFMMMQMANHWLVLSGERKLEFRTPKDVVGLYACKALFQLITHLKVLAGVPTTEQIPEKPALEYTTAFNMIAGKLAKKETPAAVERLKKNLLKFCEQVEENCCNYPFDWTVDYTHAYLGDNVESFLTKNVTAAEAATEAAAALATARDPSIDTSNVHAVLAVRDAVFNAALKVIKATDAAFDAALHAKNVANDAVDAAIDEPALALAAALLADAHKAVADADEAAYHAAVAKAKIPITTPAGLIEAAQLLVNAVDLAAASANLSETAQTLLHSGDQRMLMKMVSALTPVLVTPDGTCQRPGCLLDAGAVLLGLAAQFYFIGEPSLVPGNLIVTPKSTKEHLAQVTAFVDRVLDAVKSGNFFPTVARNIQQRQGVLFITDGERDDMLAYLILRVLGVEVQVHFMLHPDLKDCEDQVLGFFGANTEVVLSEFAKVKEQRKMWIKDGEHDPVRIMNELKSSLPTA